MIVAGYVSGQYNLTITEIFSGQAGDDLTADWFEIVNTGDAPWIQGTDPDLYYDDESMDPLDATLIEGVTQINPGGAAIVVIGADTDADQFEGVWSSVINLDGVDVGYTDGAGLGGGGDLVTLWAGDPNVNMPMDTASYPDTAPFDGQSYDVDLAEFSIVGNTNGAVATIALGGDAMDVPNIGSPGNGPAVPQAYNLSITEIFSGQAGDDLTADWFEIVNTGDAPWIQGTDPDLYYDDESMDPLDATLIEGISQIPSGGAAIVVIGADIDTDQFEGVWSSVINLNGVDVGYTDGAGLGGGGDLVAIWVGDPSMSSPVATGSYPDTELNDGQSYDITLSAFSEVGNANDAVATILGGGDGGDVPNIGSPGNQGPVLVDPNAPVLSVNTNSAVPQLNVTAEGPAYISGVISDPTDPAAVYGIPFSVADNDTPVDNITWSATSDHQEVVPDDNLLFSGSGDMRTLSITPAGSGYAAITITVEDTDGKTDTYTISYAASAEAMNPSTTRFHTGASDGSSGITTSDTLMWVADDEDQVLRLYHKNRSGYPVNMMDLSSSVGDTEIDLEGSFRVGDTIYWTGSLIEPDRSVTFSVVESGEGEETTLSYLGQYRDLREDLIAWDNADGHGYGSGYFDFAGTLEVEGLCRDLNNPDGALLALRGPLYNGNALLIPVNNFRDIVDNDVSPNSAQFGAIIELNLERRSIRSIDCNEHGCLIVAGPFGNVTGFHLFTWSGHAGDDAELRAAELNLTNFGNYEGIAGLPDVPFTGAAGNDVDVQVLIDMGTQNFYGDGLEAKDLPNDEWKKFGSEVITLDTIVIPPVAYEGDIVITEIMQNPSVVNDDAGEWFEIYNNTLVQIDINGWTFRDMDMDSIVIDNGGPLMLEPGQYFILGNNDDVLTNGGVHVDYSYAGLGDFFLANSADEIIIIAPDGVTIDSVAYDGGALWPDPSGASMALQAVNFDNNLGENWCVSSATFGDGDLGTPGMLNDCPLPPAAYLQITEAWVGNVSGSDLTADWFEITNFGEVAWTGGVDPDLYYDDESQDPGVADLINGITEILPGKSVVVVIGAASDADNFRTVWSPDYDLENVEIGWTDGAGLGQGGDGVTLFLGIPSMETIVDFESFPALPGGVSWDVVLQANSEQGVGIPQIGSNVAVATTMTNGFEPAIGSPGNEGPLAVQEFDLVITEIFSGQAGDDLTADWIEITNIGTSAWTSGVDGDLWYDDESMDPLEATLVEGLTEISPGQTAIILIGTIDAVAEFTDVWNPVIDLANVGIGYTDGAGLGGGGDLVTLWAGDPNLTMPIDTASYPDTDPFDGQSFDVDLGEFSTVGNANGAVATIALGGDAMDVPNIGSPGNGLAIPQGYNILITEIFSGQAGDDLTADWFEIVNYGDQPWTSGVSPDLYYDDESMDPSSATLIEGLTEILPGKAAIVMIGGSADATVFTDVWSPVIDLMGVDVGYTDGAGLGGGGDLVTLWMGDPNLTVPLDTASYPDAEPFDGQSYDVDLGEFSVVGNANDAVATIALGGDLMDVPNIGSPGNQGPITSVNHVDFSDHFTVFPNPSDGVFRIASMSDNSMVKGSVFNLQGQLVQQIEFNGVQQAQINLGAMPDGVYVLKLNLENGMTSVRLVKH